MSNHTKFLDHVTLIYGFLWNFLPVVGTIEIWNPWKYLAPSISEFMVLLKNGKLVCLGWHFKYYFFFDNFCWNFFWKFSWVCFLTQDIQKWHRNCPRTYWFWAIGKSYQNLPFSIYLQKKRMWHYSWVIFFF